MPRHAAAEFGFPVVPGTMPEPPEYLTPEIQKVWHEVFVGLSSERLCDPGFRLLAPALCQHVHFARILGDEAQRRLEDPEVFEDDAKRGALRALLRSHCEQTERMVSVATKMRMTPQARYYPHSRAILKPVRTGIPPWEDWGEPDDEEPEQAS